MSSAKLIEEVPILFERHGKLKQEPNLRLYCIDKGRLLTVHWYDLQAKTWELKHTFAPSSFHRAHEMIDARKAKNRHFYEVEFPAIQRERLERTYAYQRRWVDSKRAVPLNNFKR